MNSVLICAFKMIFLDAHFSEASSVPVVPSVHKMKGKVKVAQSYLTLCDRMDYTVHGIL